MKKLFLLLVLTLMCFSCRSVEKTVDKTKQSSTENIAIQKATDSIVSEESKNKEAASNNSNIKEEGFTVIATPIDSKLPSFIDDPITGKKITFQNSSITYTKKTKDETKKDSIVKLGTTKKDTSLKSFTDTAVKKDKEDFNKSKKVDKDGTSFTSYLIIFIVIAVAFLIYKRKSIAAFIARKLIV